MKLDKHVVDMFTELTKPADDVKMEKTCYGTISVVDGTSYVKLDGSDLLVPAASTVKTYHGDRVTVLMKNHSLTVTGNLTSPSAVGGGGSSGGTGTAATIKVGTVTTGEAGSSASVTNSGTTSAAVFDFVIPRGDKGEKGEKGDTGTWDGTIPDHEHTVSDITDFPTSLPANGGNADTVGAKSISQILAVKGWFDGDMDNLKEQGSYIVNDATNMPIPGGWGTALVFIGGTGSVVQVFTAYVISASDLCKTYMRHFTGDLWSTWVNIADGGNADTLDGKHANEIASNPNLLINPDFRINQRGQSEYTAAGYTVDRWAAQPNCKVTPKSSGGVRLDCLGTAYNGFYQKYDGDLSGNTVTLSLKASGSGSLRLGVWGTSIKTVTLDDTPRVYSHTFELGDDPAFGMWLSANGEYAEIEWAKLEIGSIATPFYPPDPVEELLKIQSMNDDGTPKLASNNALPTIMNSQMVSNPNLVLNPDFKINQRGNIGWYIRTTHTYFVDGWYSARTDLVLSDDGLMFAWNGTDGDNGWIQEKIESPSYFGKTVTISFNANDTIYSATIEIPTVVDSRSYTTVKGSSFLSVGVGNHQGKYFSVILLSSSTESVLIKWIKCELGSVATPFIPPNPAAELEKCQRYLTVYRGNNVRLFGGVAISDRYQNICIQTPVSMRVVPSVSYSNIVLALDKDGNTTRNISSTTVACSYATSTNHIKIRCLVDADNKLTIGETYTLINTSGTIGSFILSAEL